MAQTKSTPNGSDSAFIKNLSKSYLAQNEVFLTELKNDITDRKLQKHIESRYKAIFKAINTEINEGQMTYHHVLSPLLEETYQKIKKGNTGIPENIRIMLLKENMPNAFTIGDNTIFVTMGLLYYLDNEDQLAFTIAHEISHLMLQHSLKAMKYYYEKDKESIDDVKTVKQTEIKRTDCAIELLRESIYKSGKRARSYERQADSLGYILTKNSGYNTSTIASALNIIDQYDSLKKDTLVIETYTRFFTVPAQQFNNDWLQAEDFSSYNYNAYKSKYDKDSISSHPKSEQRIAYLKTIFSDFSETKDSLQNVKDYDIIKKAAESQRIPNLYYNEQYGMAVYLSLLCLQQQPKDTFYLKQLTRNLEKIYEARKNYQLNKYLDTVSPKDQTKSYMRFLNFMWNLKLEELENIANYYSEVNY